MDTIMRWTMLVAAFFKPLLVVKGGSMMLTAQLSALMVSMFVATVVHPEVI